MEQCDRCGADIDNAGIDLAAVVHVLLANGSPQTFHLCNAKCAFEILPSTVFAAANPVALWYDRDPAQTINSQESEAIHEPRTAEPVATSQREHGEATPADTDETAHSDE